MGPQQRQSRAVVLGRSACWKVLIALLLLLALAILLGSLTLSTSSVLPHQKKQQHDVQPVLQPTQAQQQPQQAQEKQLQQPQQQAEHASAQTAAVVPQHAALSQAAPHGGALHDPPDSEWVKGLERENLLPHCPHDATLPHPSTVQRRFFFAANFYDSEAVLPNFIVETLRLLARLPRGSAYMSVYESNSRDKSSQLLQQYERELAALGVPHKIVWGAQGGRDMANDRVAFMAGLRNAALAPLLERSKAQRVAAAAAAAAAPAGRPLNSTTTAAAGRSVANTARRRALRDGAARSGVASAHLGVRQQQLGAGHRRNQLSSKAASSSSSAPAVTENNAPLSFDPDQVLFINDVYFCGEDLLRLASLQVDIACGIDIGNTDEPQLYDIWVNRDVTGVQPPRFAPFTMHKATAALSMLGLPAPTSCCWNGMVALNAEPFLRGLRMRSHVEGECRASECSLLCHDFRRLGYNRIYMDSRVRTVYNSKCFPLIKDARFGSRSSSWGEVEAHLARNPLPLRGGRVQHTDIETCCDLKPGDHNVDFERACHPYNIFERNFTANALDNGRRLDGIKR